MERRAWLRLALSAGAGTAALTWVAGGFERRDSSSITREALLEMCCEEVRYYNAQLRSYSGTRQEVLDTSRESFAVFLTSFFINDARMAIFVGPEEPEAVKRGLRNAFATMRELEDVPEALEFGHITLKAELLTFKNGKPVYGVDVNDKRLGMTITIYEQTMECVNRTAARKGMGLI